MPLACLKNETNLKLVLLYSENSMASNVSLLKKENDIIEGGGQVKCYSRILGKAVRIRKFLTLHYRWKHFV